MCTDGSNADNSTLEPKRQDYNTLVEDVKLLNETSERGKADYESDIVYTISLGYRAYENNDQTLLTKMFKICKRLNAFSSQTFKLLDLSASIFGGRFPFAFKII